MGVIGVSLIVASVLWVIVRPPTWFHSFLLSWRGPRPAIDKPKSPRDVPSRDGLRTGERSSERAPRGEQSADGGVVVVVEEVEVQEKKPATARQQTLQDDAPTPRANEKAAKDRAAMPPPPPPITRASGPAPADDARSPEQTTPKAAASQPTSAVPSFSLAPPTTNATPSLRPPVPSFPAANSPQRASNSAAPALRPPVPAFPAANSPQRASNSANAAPTPNRLPSLFPQPQRPNPLPNRGPSAPSSSSLSVPSSSLAPPPTHSTKPAKPSRKVLLAPGHSPLDWAAISGPTSDLRGLSPETPYLRVTPAMLKRQNGRKGTDAWTVLGGRVYNISPYAPYHPGGVPELMRCAGKDGSRLFGEVHPWVNYENMLQACLVGIYVDDHEGSSNMEDMD